MALLQTIHGELRWLLILVAVVAVIRFGWGWLGRASYDRLDRGLLAAFSGLLDLNVTLGIILLLWRGVLESVWPAIRLEHGVTMLLAAFVVHLSARWRDMADDKRRFRNNLLVVLAAVVLIVVGVVRLRGGWVYG